MSSEPAFPTPHLAPYAPGLTKLEYFAGQAMQGLCAADNGSSFQDDDIMVEKVISRAEKLLKKLEENEKHPETSS